MGSEGGETGGGGGGHIYCVARSRCVGRLNVADSACCVCFALSCATPPTTSLVSRASLTLLRTKVSPKVNQMPGYGAAAVDRRGGLVCPHCKLLLRSAVQTDDGIRLCESCFNEIAG